MKRFTVTLEEDEFGEMVLPIPEEVSMELGWDLGDILEYTVTDDQLCLRKVDNGT